MSQQDLSKSKREHDCGSLSKGDRDGGDMSVNTTKILCPDCAARIFVSNLHKMTSKSFSKTVRLLHTYIHPEAGVPAPLICDQTNEILQRNKKALDAALLHDCGFEFDYFGFKTLEKSYLLKLNGRTMEHPQHLLTEMSSCFLLCMK